MTHPVCIVRTQLERKYFWQSEWVQTGARTENPTQPWGQSPQWSRAGLLPRPGSPSASLDFTCSLAGVSLRESLLRACALQILCRTYGADLGPGALGANPCSAFSWALMVSFTRSDTQFLYLWKEGNTYAHRVMLRELNGVIFLKELCGR